MLGLQNVTRIFQSGADRVTAIRNLDLALSQGDFLTVIGSNGAGKSTLLNLIAGTVRPTKGSVMLNGHDVSTMPAYLRAREIGRIVQNPLAGTAPTMTVAENLAIALKRKGRSLRTALPRHRRNEFRAQLAQLQVGLEDRMDCQASLLSGGERQALAVLMATLVSPQLLLLDEHTAALDPRNAQMIMELTTRFVEEAKLTTIMVTHNMEQAIEMGNRLVMMHAGEVIHSIGGMEKAASSVMDLVELFSGRNVVDDELLLERVAEAPFLGI